MKISDEKEEYQEDEYGNPLESDGTCDKLIYCCFPDCGCDGSRLCMAKNGASDIACRGNVEGMYRRKDKEAVKAKMILAGLVIQRERNNAKS